MGRFAAVAVTGMVLGLILCFSIFNYSALIIHNAQREAIIAEWSYLAAETAVTAHQNQKTLIKMLKLQREVEHTLREYDQLERDADRRNP